MAGALNAAASLPAWRSSGRDFNWRGHRIRYWLDGRAPGPGSGVSLCCVHGFPTASWDWHKLWPALTARFDRVVAIDMIGFGDSAKPRGHDYSILDQTDLHEALLSELGIAQTHVLAHDYGDTVAQEWLARHNARTAQVRLSSLCLLNGGLFPEVHRPRRVQKLLASPLGPLVGRLMRERSFRRSFAAVFGPHTQPDDAELAQFWSLIAHNHGPRIMHRLIGYIEERARHRTRWVGALQETTVPLRFINGLEDPVSGAHMLSRYRELIAAADTVELPGIGHYPQVEAPEAVLAALESFWSTRCRI